MTLYNIAKASEELQARDSKINKLQTEIAKLNKENQNILSISIQLKQDSTVAMKSIGTLQQENLQLKQENLKVKESIDTFEQDKKAALAAQKERHINRHNQILNKVSERFADKLNVSLKPLQEQILLISTENENLRKKLSLLEKERNFFVCEYMQHKDQPAVHSSLKGVQQAPIDLSSSNGEFFTTFPSLVQYLDRLKMLREAGGLQPH